MDHHDHVALLRGGGIRPGSTWADFGAGRGAFTRAAADLMGGEGTLFAIDRDGDALRDNAAQMSALFPSITFRPVTADFASPLDLPPLDGIIMANALHFVRDQRRILEQARNYLRSGAVPGRLILVEYNADRGNQWVPFPIPAHSWPTLAERCGFAETRQIGARPSRFLGEIYSCVSLLPASAT